MEHVKNARTYFVQILSQRLCYPFIQFKQRTIFIKLNFPAKEIILIQITQRKINIQDLSTASYSAAHTGTQMFSVHMSLDVPADTHIAGLREEFLDFCDRLNLDAVIEPVKG